MNDDDNNQSQQAEREHQKVIAALIQNREEDESFVDWARHTLAYERGRAAAFEVRLATVWQEALDLFELIHCDLRMLGETFNHQHRPQAAADHDLVFEAITRLHGRACGITSEVYALLKTGHAAGALARWRSLQEVRIVVQLIRTNGNELAERFILHDSIIRWLAAKEFQDHAAELGEVPLEQTVIDQLERTKKALCEKYKDPRYAHRLGWASALLHGKKLGWDELEKEAKLSQLRPCYTLASDSIHAGMKGMKRTIFTMGDDVMLAGPSNYGLADPAILTLQALYDCTVALLTLKPSDHGEAELTILGQLVSQAGDAFTRIQAKIEQDEASLRASESQARTEE